MPRTSPPRALLALVAVLAAPLAAAQTLPAPGALAAEAEAAGLAAAAVGTSAEVEILRASAPDSNDDLGTSVAVSGDVAVVGAPGDDGASDTSFGTGAAVVFTRVGGAWTETQVLRPSNPSFHDQFGYSVAIDGATIVVGARWEDGADGSTADAGAVYVFEESGGTWTETQILRALNAGASDEFGSSVGVSGDAIVVGARFEDGAAGANHNTGAAYVFEKSEGTWSQVQVLRTADLETSQDFGRAVGIDGWLIVVGASSEDGPAGTAINAGGAFVFEKSGGAWPATETEVLRGSEVGPGDTFGTSVSVSGTAVLVGAPSDDGFNDPGGVNVNDGAAYLFETSGGTWAETALLRASNAGPSDVFGTAVAISGDVALVGATGEDDGASNGGAAYLVQKSMGTWSETQILRASNAGSSDAFGAAVALSGVVSVIGAAGEDGATNSTGNSGAAYVFEAPAVFAGAAEGWHLVAAPGDAETVGSFFGPVWTQCFPGADADFGGCTSPNVFTYDETASGGAAAGFEAPADASDPLGAGTGVFAYLFADDDNDGADDPFPKPLPLLGDGLLLPFTWGDGGDAPLSYSDTADPAADDGWNLLGNPLRGLFSWDATWDNGAVNVEPTAEAYDADAASFSTFNADTGVRTGEVFTASGELPEGAGFFVQTTGASPSLTAPGVGDPRTTSTVAPHVAVRFTATDGASAGRSAELAVALVDGASFGDDPGDAAARLPYATPYVVAGAVTEPGGPAYASASVPGPSALAVGAEIDLGVGSVDVGGVAVTWRLALPDGWTATLVDRRAGAEVAMADGGSYATDLADADGEPTPGRFVLRLAPEGAVAAEDAAEGGSVSLVRPNPTARRAEVVVSPAGPGAVRAIVVDAVGREVAVLHDGPMAGPTRLELDAGRLAPGVYVVRVTGPGVSASRPVTVVR